MFLGASLLTVMEMGEFLLLSAVSFCKHLAETGKIQQKARPEDSVSYCNNNLSVGKHAVDGNDVFGTIYSIPKFDGSTRTVHKIKVQEYS